MFTFSDAQLVEAKVERVVRLLDMLTRLQAERTSGQKKGRRLNNNRWWCSTNSLETGKMRKRTKIIQEKKHILFDRKRENESMDEKDKER